MIQRMVTSAVFAGFAAGLLAALLHFAFVQKLILLGEGYESGAVQHFGGLAAGENGNDAAPEATLLEAAPAATAEDGHDSHSPEAAAPAENRNAMTSLFFGLTYIAYALLLTAGFGLAQVYGKAIGLREGLLWGLAGFAAFQLAPAMGLAPELPGAMAADMTARQVWWLGTAVSTGLALAVLGYGKGALSLALVALLLALPHVIGAPHPVGFSGVAPPELAAAFATRSLGVGLVVWAALGALAGQFWSGKPL